MDSVTSSSRYITSASRYIMSASRYITSASRFHSRYQSISSMYFRGLIPRNFAELVEAVPIAIGVAHSVTEWITPGLLRMVIMNAE